MSKNQVETENDLSIWVSTYGLVTAGRILGTYNIKLQDSDLVEAMRNTHSFYHRLLSVSLINVFNGIIFQQVHDYQTYAQKLFIDYLLSGDSEKSEEASGAGSREDLEVERQAMMQLSESLSKQEQVQEKLIAESQRALMNEAQKWHSSLLIVAKNIRKAFLVQGNDKTEDVIINALNVLFIQYDFSKGETLTVSAECWLRVEERLEQKLPADLKQLLIREITQLSVLTLDLDTVLSSFTNQAGEMSSVIRSSRSSFYDLLLRVNNLMKLLPDYRVDEEKDQANRELLAFDAKIGETEVEEK